ncbi:lyase family protein [Mycobacterium arosiense]|uniref:3-carboxy-cis,cis-muconate cycloisomerase n=1 Tax=Mycobacterium arosiense ATCC BAA-1401 = DSM 45069 TaxID=1265311 RepID=A0A1W9ZHL6_MYCAI|nr:lyase family protein [Mycobacterium arosiense]ORA15175.1 3-carboxy-cis,cis-muconate cycloisomerase [Mycobacterium arosiense ATCC BAA-1401 = DSM 45069]
MTNLLWPGDDRAGLMVSDAAVWAAMLRFESAWLAALAQCGLIPATCTDCKLASLVDDNDLEHIARSAERGGNPVIALVALLRRRAPEPTRAWIHRGLTSQDVMDSALMLTLRDALAQLRAGLGSQLSRLHDLAFEHRRTPMVARTLTKHAVPTTFGVKAAGWLSGVCDAARRVTRLSTPVQIGGAAGTLAASTELAALLRGSEHATDVAIRLCVLTADAVGLQHRPPWHTSRGPITAIGDALVSCTDAWGRIATDVLILNRPEIGEVAEKVVTGRGGSSTMPEKHNPVLSVLIRRAALTSAPLASVLHSAAGLSEDDRSAGAWHAEWDTLRTLARRTLVASSQATELLNGLEVNAERMAANLEMAAVSGEQNAIAALTEKPPSPTYFGTADQLITAALDRARCNLKELA